MLTWEDAYYDNHEPSDPSKNTVANMCSTDTLANFHGSHYMGDPLGLAVAKMSYLVYSLGEGYVYLKTFLPCTKYYGWQCVGLNR